MKQIWTDPLYKLFVFDAYGTLFKVTLDAPEVREACGDQTDTLQELWRQKQLEYSWVRSLMGRWVDFDQITEEALDFALQSHGLLTEPLKKLLLHTYAHPAIHEDVKPFLGVLEEEGMPAAILSNGTHEGLETATKANQIEGYFTKRISAEDVEMYKPSPLMYRLVQQLMKVQPEEVVFFSSNAWDIAGASTAGFTTVWVNRDQQQWDALGTEPSYEIESLEELI